MTGPGTRWLWAVFLTGNMVVLVGSACVLAQPPADAPRLADYFGFQPLEIYKMERRIGNLLIRDVDGDKTGDIIVGNNARSRIDLLLSSKRPAGEAEALPFRKETNDLEFDKRMRLKSIPVNKEVVSLASGDFNGDGKTDLVYYGTPAEVEILFNEGAGRFGHGKKVNTGDGVETPNALAVGDLNQDGRDDIALLAENDLVFVYQTATGVLSEPERVPHTASNPRLLRLMDLDGNGALDLVLLDGGTDHPIHVRFATKEKKLGPEQRFQVEAPRAIAFGQIDGVGGEEILTIENQSGRGKVLTLDESAADEQNRWGRMIFFGLAQGSDRGRTLAIGDLDGDRRADVVVSDPASAQVWVYRQSGRSGLSAGQSFPGLLGGTTVRLADLDRDGREEIYVLSQQEKQIGRSVMEGGRVTFPASLPAAGEPVAMDLGDLDGDGLTDVVYIARVKSPGSPDAYTLLALQRNATGAFHPLPKAELKIPGLNDPPSGLKAIDVNHDKVTDFMVFTGYGTPILLIGRKDGPPRPFTGSLGPMAAATPASLSLADLGGPALIVAQNTFARQIVLDSGDQWQIKSQFNSGRNSAIIQGAAAIDADGDGKKEIVLMERNSRSLLFLTQKEGVYRPAGTLAVGAINFEGLHVADFDGDGRDDLLIAGSDRFGVLQTGRKGQRLKTIASYESKRNEARFADLIAGDLNADGAADVVFMDVAEQMLEIASYAGDLDLLHAISFKIFERKLFHGVGDMIEPRDQAIGDVDGDGREDLVLIAHDRVLVLRQDPGTGGRKPAQAAAGAAASR